MRRALLCCCLWACGDGGADSTDSTLIDHSDGSRPDEGPRDSGIELDGPLGADAATDASQAHDAADILPDAAACSPTGFGNVGQRWSLPGEFGRPLHTTSSIAPQGDCASINYSLASLRSGEGPDLVMTHECEQGLGQSFWRSFRNTGSGFADASVRWPLPDGYQPADFSALVGANPNGCDPPNYSVLDLDGEGGPDLVVTHDCERGSGTAFWRAYPNTGGGFANVGARWTLPGDFGEGAFTQLASNSPNDCTQPSYGLLDLTGDGLLDLVVTLDCGPRTGRDEWLVYPNTGSGFSQAPTEWALPRIADNQRLTAFAHVEPREICDTPSYSLFDMDGDKKLDLVVTHDCESGSAQRFWRVYRNIGDGFAQAGQRWSLPAGFPADTFYTTAFVAPRDVCDPVSYSLLDLTLDGRADLVLTRDCADRDSGTRTWRVFANTGSGFASASQLWSLPDGYAEGDFHTLGGVSSPDDCNPPTFGLMDLDANGQLELVVTHDCERGSGEQFWRAYPMVCR